jgi:hypothetical protein
MAEAGIGFGFLAINRTYFWNDKWLSSRAFEAICMAVVQTSAIPTKRMEFSARKSMRRETDENFGQMRRSSMGCFSACVTLYGFGTSAFGRKTTLPYGGSKSGRP